MGRRDLIHNVSNIDLTEDQVSALSLGLKFTMTHTDRKLEHWVTKNYRHDLSDIDLGFIQGIVTCLESMSRAKEQQILPLRFMNAIKELGNDPNIVISPCDKGGGVAVLSRKDYLDKMADLLSDQENYNTISTGSCAKKAKDFNQAVRKILKRSPEGKSLWYLIEEDPQPPRMYGLPKTHKPDVPMRQITSGCGSAPHRIAKVLAKQLSEYLGTISGAHLNNSHDLKQRLKAMNFKNKKLVSFDVKSMFTNVPVEDALKVVE